MNHICVSCQATALWECNMCRAAFYCSSKCIQDNWHNHKGICRPKAAAAEADADPMTLTSWLRPETKAELPSSCPLASKSSRKKKRDQFARSPPLMVSTNYYNYPFVSGWWMY